MDDARGIAELRQNFLDIANARTERMLYLDEFSGLLDIEFDFRDDHNTAPWPKAFEHHLKAMPSIPLSVHKRRTTQSELTNQRSVATLKQNDNDFANGTRYGCQRHVRPVPAHLCVDSAQGISMGSPSFKKGLRPTHRQDTSLRKGRDFLPFNGYLNEGLEVLQHHGMSGILHDLPDQSGIPGFQRVSFMTYELGKPAIRDEAASMVHDHCVSQVDDTFICYEGVVLPGSHIILGHWWNPLDNEEQYQVGPFIFWEVKD